MDSHEWKRVEHILDTVLESDPGDWPALLDRACAGDAALRASVERLLRRHGEARSFLSTPPGAVAAALVHETRDGGTGPDRAGERIGAYRVVREIGQGGTSRVFLAERADGAFEQRVALKLLRAGLDTEVDRARFRAERRMLAALDHPNIARLLDGGVAADGRPYLALEYVDGRPIDVDCDARDLGPRARVRRFLDAARATQHAHQNLIIHRDLKPSNILITTDGRVKLLDFGLAKLLESADAPHGAPTTQPGRRWLTPEYAAPEQVRGAPATTLTDVYQLGAALYELLAGTPPFGTRATCAHALDSAILNDDPRPPSAAAPPARRAGLAGDLDAIVLKALRKEPAQRYASVQALIDDLERHLSGHAVLARRQTLAYRARRFVRRHRSAVAAAVALALVLSAYLATVIADRRRIAHALEQARLGTHKAEQVTDFMLGLFDASASGQTLGDTVTARVLLARGVARAHSLAGQPDLEAQMLDVIGRVETQLGMYIRAQSHLEEALAIRRSLHGESHPDVATSLQALGTVLYSRGDFAGAERLRRRELELRRTLLGPADPRTTNALFELATAMHAKGDFQGAQPLVDEWVAIVSRQPPVVTRERAEQLSALCVIFEYRGQLERAERFARDAMAINLALYGDAHPRYAQSLTDLGEVLDQRGRRDSGEALLRRSVAIVRSNYPTGHPELAGMLRTWATVLMHLGRYSEAEAPLREAIAMGREFQGPESPLATDASLDLAMVMLQLGRPDDAVSLSRASARQLRTRLGAANPVAMRAQITYGDALRAQGHYAHAESLLLAAYAVFADGKGFSGVPREYALNALVRLYQAEGRDAEAGRYAALRRPRP